MKRQYLKLLLITVAALQSACATACLTPAQIETNHINQYGSVDIGEALTQIERDIENFKEIDTDKARELIKNRKATPFAKTQLYSLLATHYANTRDIEKLIVAEKNAINADGFENIDEKNAYIKFTTLTENKINEYSDLSPDEIKNNTPSAAQVRFAPAMPYQANKSGHCYIEYDVSKEGNTENIHPLYCTTGHFKVAATRNIAGWRFRPKRVNGENVKDFAQVSKVIFRLSDSCGNLIP